MRVIRVPSAQALAIEAADRLEALLRDNPRSALALPTGDTPLGLYAELVRRARSGAGALREAHVFDLDEYCGIAREDARSFASFLARHLTGPLQISKDRVDLLDGASADLEAECERYERAIAARSGLDLCVLGLGENGHIAFNEPGTSFSTRTHVAPLAPVTRARLEERGWEAPRVPTHGITLGIRNVLEARQVLLLIAGRGKKAAAAALHRGIEDESWPVTCLLRHPQVTVIEACEPALLP